MLSGVLGFFAQEQVQERIAERAANTEAPSPPPEMLFAIGPLDVTNTVLTAWVVIILLVLFAYFSTRRMEVMPRGLQNFWELIIELWVGVTENTMGRRRGRRFLPLVATAFLFILFSNWFGTLPIAYFTVTNVEGEHVELFRSANSDLNITAAMAVSMIFLAEFFELRSLGLLGYV